MVASALASFIATLAFLPWLIRSLRGTSAVGKDLNKPGRPLIPEMGGLAVVLGFYVGVGLLVALALDEIPGPFYYASLVAVLGAAVVGLMDDMFRIRNRMKALLPFLMAIPLGSVVYASGDTSILGLDVGLLILVAVPLGITCAANAANMLEGLNGLGAGMGVIMSIGLVAIAWSTGETQGLYLVFPLLGALVAFLLFNKYPAKVFPGDSMTLFAGAAIAAAAIVAHQKTYGALLFIPMIAEFFLKVRGRFQGENYGSPDQQGRLHYHGRIESLAHLIMTRRPMKEWQVVLVLWSLEGALCVAILASVLL